MDGFLGLKPFAAASKQTILIDPPYNQMNSPGCSFVPSYKRFPTGIYAIGILLNKKAEVSRFYHTLKEADLPIFSVS